MHPSSTPQSPTAPSTPSWKSVFLRRPTSSAKKLAREGLASPALKLDTRALSSPAAVGDSKSPITPKTSLTPASVLTPADHRSSYNSSNTQSSESNARPFPRSHQSVTVTRPNSSYQQEPGTDGIAAGVQKSRLRTKSEKHTQRGALGRSQRGATLPLPALPAQPEPKSPRSPPSAHRPVSRGMGALPRFIRRVASAPNAKDLFSPKSKSATKNGLLAPAEVPPVPVMPTSTSSELGAEHGTGSLETASSGSSRGRSLQPTRVSPGMIANGLTADTPQKAAFRRTYSSNSIKIRSVSSSRLSYESMRLILISI